MALQTTVQAIDETAVQTTANTNQPVQTLSPTVVAYSMSKSASSATRDDVSETSVDSNTEESPVTIADDARTTKSGISTTKYSFTTQRGEPTSTEGGLSTTRYDYTVTRDYQSSTDSTESFSTSKKHKSTTRTEDLVTTTKDVLDHTSIEVHSTTHSVCSGFPVYVYHGTSLTMQAAQTVCSEQGGKIVEIESAEEQQCLNYLFNLYYDQWYWIGAYNYNADSTYEFWSNASSPLNFTNWNTNQPTKSSTYLCVYANRVSQYKWKTCDCFYVGPFFCEMN